MYQESTNMVDIVSNPEKDDIIVDIRSIDEYQDTPLTLTQQIVHFPFYKMETFQKHIDSNKRYLLYCDRNIMSRIQAELLVEKGVTNVHILKLK